MTGSAKRLYVHAVPLLTTDPSKALFGPALCRQTSVYPGTPIGFVITQEGPSDQKHITKSAFEATLASTSATLASSPHLRPIVSLKTSMEQPKCSLLSDSASRAL